MDYSHSVCQLTIAGPGAGKTNRMVDLVEKCIPNLTPNRFIAVITYTNEATKEIQNRLKNKIKLPNNLFIGTIHSFLIKFIFEPYAHVFDMTNVDKHYIEKIELDPKYRDKLYGENDYEVAVIREQKTTTRIAEEVLKSGFVVYDQILEKAHTLISNERVCSIVANRLQYIFVDEYQDSRIYQHEILMKIFLKGNTSIYAIGDPMQSIFGFSYKTSQLRNEPTPESFNQLPINTLEDICNQKEGFTRFILEENYRSRPKIVTFINNFNVKFNQQPVRKDSDVPVVFINETNIELLIEKFLSLKEKYDIKDEVGCRIDNLFLSRNWSCFEEIAPKFGISRISNDINNSNLLFRETLNCILRTIGKNRRQLNEEFGINEISLRKFIFKFLKDIRSANYTCEDILTLKNKVIKDFTDYFCIDSKIKIHPDLCTEDPLKKIIRSDISKNHIGYYSTVHSAKGLEAGSVLVIAESKNLLRQWLSPNKNDFKKLNDSYRLGFVGFSRARNFLCIACLENFFPELENILNNFNVEIEPPLNKSQKTLDFFFNANQVSLKNN